MEATEATCLLLDLSHDEQGIVTHELCDPLRPLLAVHLSNTAKGLWVPMQEQLAELKQRHAEAAAFAAFLGMSCAALADQTGLQLCKGPPSDAEVHAGLALGHWRTLGMLVGCGSLPKLERLAIGIDTDEEGVALLAAGLRRGRLPSLRVLCLGLDEIPRKFGGAGGPQGVTALVSALTKRALPSLTALLLQSPLDDAGQCQAALLSALRRLPPLNIISLADADIGDEFVASLVAQPTEVLKSLDMLDLSDNEITDAGCATLATALRDGALEELTDLRLDGNPASGEAQGAATALPDRRSY